MAVLAIPALEAAVTALLVALGIGVGTAVVADEVKRRQRAASDAGASDVAKTASQTRTKTCEKCPPDCGQLVERNWNMSAAAREYQARVTGFAPYTEWAFGGIDFDGFASADCMLKEAKSRYDQFLTQGEDAELEPRKWYKAFELKMLPQARKQASVAMANPPSRLTWFFQGPLTYEYMRFSVMAFAPLVAVFVP
jgi:hypothetical protein